MAPSRPDPPAMPLDHLRQAVAIYLAHAYPNDDLPESVRRRLDWPDAPDTMALLTRAPFERANRSGGEASPVYALRLGNAQYPHMKLQVQPWPNPSGLLLSVNTHDQALALNLNPADADAFRALQAENQRLKEAIEQNWDQAGLPTFLRYLRDYIEANLGRPPLPSPSDNPA